MVNGSRAGFMGMGCEGAKYFTIYYTGTLQENMMIFSGILKEKIVPVSVPSRTVLWCRNGVVRAVISFPHL